MKKYLVNNKGLTLIEIIITIAILGIIITPIFSMFLTTARANSLADEKMRATAAAQKVMENVKTALDIDSIETEQEIDGFRVTIQKEPTEYTFADVQSQMSADENPYDLKIELYDSNLLMYDYFDNELPLISDRDNSITIEYQTDSIYITQGVNNHIVSVYDKPDVRFEFYGDRDIIINAENKDDFEPLEVYIMKSVDINPDYTFNNKGGSIMLYENILINESDTELESNRVYRINIQVKNDKDKLIKEIFGYKTFLQ